MAKIIPTTLILILNLMIWRKLKTAWSHRTRLKKSITNMNILAGGQSSSTSFLGRRRKRPREPRCAIFFFILLSISEYRISANSFRTFMYCDKMSQYIRPNSKKNNFRRNYSQKYGMYINRMRIIWVFLKTDMYFHLPQFVFYYRPTQIHCRIEWEGKKCSRY